MRLIKNKFSIISIFLVLIFSGCNKKLYVISQDSLFDRGLEYTKISNIIYQNDTKALINATYLNPTNPSKYDNGKEVFLLGIYYSVGDSANLNNGLNNTDYILSLNKKTNYTKEVLDESDELFKAIPVQNPYAKYYIVEFDNDKTATLNLSLSHKKFGTSSSVFKTF